MSKMQVLLDDAICIRQYLTYPARQERNQTLSFYCKSKALLNTSGDIHGATVLHHRKYQRSILKRGQSALSISQPKTTARLIFFYKGIKFKLLKLAIVSPEPLLHGPIQSSIV